MPDASLLATVGAWSFTGTSACTFTIGGNSEVSFTGAGINVGGGSVNIINNWALQFQNSSTAGSASITNNAQTAFLHSSSAGTANIINNGTVQFSQSSTAGSATVTTNNAAIVHFLDTSTGGNARFITNAGGKFDMSALTSAGMTAGSIQGAGNYLLGSKTLTVGSNNLSTMVAGVISDGGGTGGALTKVGTGTLTVTGINTYTGASTINGGTLVVNGSIANSSIVTVNSGGTLSGTGIVDPATTTIMSGGTLRPGNTANPDRRPDIYRQSRLSIRRALCRAGHAVGCRQHHGVRHRNAHRRRGECAVCVRRLSFLRQYTILTAAGGLGGTTFASLTSINLPAGFTDSLSYSGNSVFLNLLAANGRFRPRASIKISATSPAALNNFFNSGGAPPRFRQYPWSDWWQPCEHPDAA